MACNTSKYLLWSIMEGIQFLTNQGRRTRDVELDNKRSVELL